MHMSSHCMILLLYLINNSEFYHPDSSIVSVAACAGSGASVLTGVKADLYITGRAHIHHHIIGTVPSTVNSCWT